MPHGIRFGLIVPAALLVLSGCATRGWVREQMGQQESQANQRFATVEKSVDEDRQRIGDVEARVTEQGQASQNMGEQMGGLRTSVGEASNLARGAGERADGAMARANEVDGRLTRLWNSRDQRSLVETIEIRFPFAKADLSDAAQTALVDLANEMKGNARLAVELEGYTDSSGSLEYNLALSQRRVEAVRRFLVRRGIELRRITAAGLGPIEEAGLPAAQKRRVTVRLTTPAD